jgi:hypothetical protein
MLPPDGFEFLACPFCGDDIAPTPRTVGKPTVHCVNCEERVEAPFTWRAVTRAERREWHKSLVDRVANCGDREPKAAPSTEAIARVVAIVSFTIGAGALLLHALIH